MEWEIQRRSEACSRCGNPFSDGDEYYTGLAFEEGNEIRRMDACSGCAPALIGSAFSIWKGRITVPSPPPEPVPGDVSEKLLRRFIQENETTTLNVRYVLAVMLERKKVLVQRERITASEEGADRLVYEHRSTGETLIVEDPHLSLSEIGAVQEEVKEILDREISV